MATAEIMYTPFVVVDPSPFPHPPLLGDAAFVHAASRQSPGVGFWEQVGIQVTSVSHLICMRLVRQKYHSYFYYSINIKNQIYLRREKIRKQANIYY